MAPSCSGPPTHVDSSFTRLFNLVSDLYKALVLVKEILVLFHLLLKLVLNYAQLKHSIHVFVYSPFSTYHIEYCIVFSVDPCPQNGWCPILLNEDSSCKYSKLWYQYFYFKSTFGWALFCNGR